MRHDDRYREHRVKTSLAPHLGRSVADDREIRELAREAWRQSRAVTFLPEDLERMPWQARELIEGEATRLYGKKWGR